MQIRLATPQDSEQLYLLNEKFNGKDETTLDNIELLTGNKNLEAQALYDTLGYRNEGELHLSKQGRLS